MLLLVGGVVPGGEVPEGSLTFMEPSQPRLAQARSAAHAQMKGEEMFNVLLGLGWDKRCNFISAVYYSRLESDHRLTIVPHHNLREVGYVSVSCNVLA